MEIYKDSTKPVMERVEDLLGRMTLEEKAAQLCGDLPMELVQDGMPSVDLLKKKFCGRDQAGDSGGPSDGEPLRVSGYGRNHVSGTDQPFLHLGTGAGGGHEQHYFRRIQGGGDQFCHESGHRYRP